MRALLIVVSALVLTACPARHRFPQLVARGEPVQLIRDVSVFDGRSERLLEHQDVAIDAQGLIKSLTPHGSTTCDDCVAIDGRGKTLMPGLVNMHVHLQGSAAPPWHLAYPDEAHTGAALLYSGITSAQDVGGELDGLAHLKADAAWLGPDFIYTGPHITPVGGYPASMVRELLPWPFGGLVASRIATEIASPADAGRAVEERLARGATLIKVAVAQVPLDAPVYDAELLAAVVKAAHARKVKVVAHIDTAAHAMLAARAGVDMLVHGVHLGALTETEAAELKTLGTIVVPTLVVFDRIEQLAEHRFVPTALDRETLPDDFLQPFLPEETRKHSVPKPLNDWIVAVQATKPQRLEAVKRLSDAGVPLLVGADDAGSVGCTPGAAYHAELQLLAAAGVPTLDILRGATSRAAEAMGGNFGVIEPGAKADLLLVEGDPLADLSAVSRIVQVIKSGRALKRTPVAR